MPHRASLVLPLAISLMAATGCHEGPKERLAEAARQSVEQQSRQNEQMARHNQQLTEAARQLVEADARARQEMIEAQHTQQQAVQAERASLDRQHEELEQERRQVAQYRHRDPILAAAITSAGLLLACLLPLSARRRNSVALKRQNQPFFDGAPRV